MKRRLLPILMTLVLVCALPIWAAFVTSGDVTNPLVCTAGATELTLQGRIDKANAGDTITLSSDTEIAATLQIAKNLTLDLNGCVLRMRGTGSVLEVSDRATLTITDSSAAKSGTITGGNAEDGGGVYIGDNSSEGHLVMTGGTITGCATDHGRGGGVFVFKGSFTMSGTAKITNCTAVWGGGVVVHTGSSTFTMNGGEISDCKASYTGGGVCLVGGAWFEMTGGTIRNCTAGSVESSAIYMDPGTMKAHGGTVKGNVCVSGVGNCVITHEPSQEGYTIFDETITFEGNGSTTAMYPVKFDLDQGSDNDITVRETKLGSPAEKPADPTKPNLVFQYWYEAGTDGSAAWNFSTPVTRPLHLLAKWEEKPQTGGYYYAPPAEQPIEAPKTADPGVALYAALSLLSLTGLTCATKKR
ncbi:InlB B-repeat-containing protein [Vescimonas sanitatis]|uniref:InlB B-repeat-containing protein n=1 Tax=Vescimonas sanitatis TaxID=3376993 RepID=UPI003B812294